MTDYVAQAKVTIARSPNSNSEYGFEPRWDPNGDGTFNEKQTNLNYFAGMTNVEGLMGNVAFFTDGVGAGELISQTVIQGRQLIISPFDPSMHGNPSDLYCCRIEGTMLVAGGVDVMDTMTVPEVCTAAVNPLQYRPWISSNVVAAAAAPAFNFNVPMPDGVNGWMQLTYTDASGALTYNGTSYPLTHGGGTITIDNVNSNSPATFYGGAGGCTMSNGILWWSSSNVTCGGGVIVTSCNVGSFIPSSVAWTSVTGAPNFLTSASNLAWGNITGAPNFLTSASNLAWANITGAPNFLTSSSNVAWAQITGAPTNVVCSNLTAASKVVSSNSYTSNTLFASNITCCNISGYGGGLTGIQYTSLIGAPSTSTTGSGSSTTTIYNTSISVASNLSASNITCSNLTATSNISASNIVTKYTSNIFNLTTGTLNAGQTSLVGPILSGNYAGPLYSSNTGFGPAAAFMATRSPGIALVDQYCATQLGQATVAGDYSSSAQQGDVVLCGNVSGYPNVILQSQYAGPAQLYLQGSTGSVGIGTTSPQQKLHVYGGGISTSNLSIGAIGLPGTYSGLPSYLYCNTSAFLMSNVGIGTTSLFSGALVTVNSTTAIQMALTGTNPKLLLHGGTVYNAFLGLNTAAGNYTTGASVGDMSIGTQGATPQNIFFSGNYPNSTNAQLTILGSSGCVGVGTTNPTNMLQVVQPASGSATNNAFKWSNTYPNVLGYLGADASAYNSGCIYIYQNGSANTVISGNGNTYFMGGNVGVGMVPTSALSVSGGIIANGVSVYCGSSTTNNRLFLQATNDNNHCIFNDYAASAGSANAMFMNCYNGLYVRTGSAGATTDLVVQSGAVTVYGYILCTGSISATSLSINGNGNFNGAITAQSAYSQFGGAQTDNQTIGASFYNNFGGWIGATFGSTSGSSDRVVIGSLSGYGAGIGSHNYNLTAWSTLFTFNAANYGVSDSNVKTHIVSADVAICYETIKSLPLVRFSYNSNVVPDLIGNDKTLTGVLAQDLQTYFPKSVKVMSNSSNATTSNCVTQPDFLTVNHDQLYFTLIGAVQKLMGTVEALTSNVAALMAVSSNCSTC